MAATTSYDSTATTPLQRIRYLKIADHAWNKARRTYNIFEKADKVGKVSSKGWEFPIPSEGNFHVVAISAGGTLPGKGASEHLSFTGSFFRCRQGVVLDEKELDTIDGNEAYSYGPNLVTRAYQDATDSLIKQTNILFFGTGNGKLATITANYSSSTSLTTGSGDKAFLLRKGNPIDLYDSGLSTKRNSGQVIVDAISQDFGTVTVDTAVTGSSTDVIVLQGGVTNGFFHGLGYHVASSGTYQGQSRTTYPVISSPTLDAASAYPLNEVVAKQISFKVDQRGTGDHYRDLKIITGYDQLEQYFQQGFAKKRFDGGSQKYDGGFRDASIEGVDVIADADCPLGTVYFVHPRDFRWVIVRTIGKLNDRHSDLIRNYDGTNNAWLDQFIGWLGFDGEIVGAAPQRQAVVTSLSTANAANYRTWA